MTARNDWFASLTEVHRTPGRIRWRYRLQAKTPTDARVIAQTVDDLPGVVGVRVNDRVRALIVQFDPSAATAKKLRDLILNLSKPHLLPSRRELERPREYSTPAGVLARLAVLLASMTLPMRMLWPATLWAALPAMNQGLRDLFRQGLSSHVLEAMAVSISIIRRDYLAANTTSFLLSLGEHLESSIQRRSDDMLKDLLKPVSAEVWIKRGEEEVLVPAASVKVGDIVVVGVGAIIPIDGTVMTGEATVNEASMTGESIPVSKRRGDTVLSGSLVEEGRIGIYAERVGAKTAAARIADYVEQSLMAKSETQIQAARLADRLVPSVLGLAGGAYSVSGDWMRAAAVLQADYSCALKLATPVAFKSAMYGMGQSGILVKGANALERLAEADTFVFDKTGTLTAGRLEVTDSIVFDSAYTANDLICLAASVEEHYFHPLALAVVAAAQSVHCRHFNHTDVQFIVAHGVASEVEGKRIVVGSRHFVAEDEGIDFSPHLPVIESLYREGKTLLYIGFGGMLIGVLALKDQVRANSAETIHRLRALGVRRILLLTGDHHQRASEMARELGLDEFHAELLPEDKARIVERLSQEGSRIAFIGDGINDAPALAGAHVGIAMQQGADIARISSDIALLEDDIGRVADARALADATMGLIKTNYHLILGLNTGILGAAALGLLSPNLTSVLHNGATIGILLKALRGRTLQTTNRPRRSGLRPVHE